MQNIKFSAILLLSIFMLNCNADKNKKTEENMNEPAEKVLRHVVLFKFKGDASKEKIGEIEKAFSDLPSKIPQIKDYEWGINNSPEGLDKGLTHCFLVTFENEEDRARYLPHPDHKAFVEILKPHLADAVVVDYWTTSSH